MAPKGDASNKQEAVDLTATSEKKNATKKKEEEQEESMSEEDLELKERLETCVSTVINKEKEAAVTIALRQKALDVIVNELRTATSSMTSVPKPLKFLRPHFADIQTLYQSLVNNEAATAAADNETLEFRARLSDVLSVLAMTMGKPGEIDLEKYCMSVEKNYVLTHSLFLIQRNESRSSTSYWE
jgi:26S proteasome regulatory subunit N1